MNFLQLVEAVQQGASVEAVAASHTTEPTAELLYVYMTPSVSLTNELAFFNWERVPSTIFFTVDGVEYESFFSASELADLISEYAAYLGAAASPLAIAKAVLDYHKYDA
ncbi:hypothetical protein GCM10023172_31240 [Hymenobacter ginsengisoli]|uniref:Uncharacterized protein n=1 Tax=Hymenobacter ginsengisoli TaxID=1051626 RepID=A0ABP8QNK5_9BACT|nr:MULTISPECIES: hypothetical protein [unclassified Hymenobacter]MBO2031334.1 hypothetical protein [Hymenobacter sp. BT559]